MRQHDYSLSDLTLNRQGRGCEEASKTHYSVGNWTTNMEDLLDENIQGITPGLLLKNEAAKSSLRAINLKAWSRPTYPWKLGCEAEVSRQKAFEDYYSKVMPATEPDEFNIDSGPNELLRLYIGCCINMACRTNGVFPILGTILLRISFVSFTIV